MDDNRLNTLDRSTSIGLILIALFQGVALYALHLAVEHAHWLATDQRWLGALYSITIVVPAFYLISMVRLRERINLIPLLLIPLLFWMGWHLGWATPMPEVPYQNSQPLTASFCMTVGVAMFILALFFRSSASSGTWPKAYQPLLNYSWEFALTIAQVSLFIGVFWAILGLWGALFAAIGIDFFARVFQEPVFIYPVTWLILGIVVVMIRNRFRFLASVRLMCEALIKTLLPLVALVILLFFAVLPWTGLEPIWDTGKAAQILMALMLTLLLFFNAVFHQTQGNPPYPVWLRNTVLMAVVLLPIGSLLAAWALWLRIDQYGLSLDRLWAGLLQALTAAFTFSYSLILLWRRQAALPSLHRVNKWLALLVASVLMLVNTPLADMRHWSAQHQVNRLLDGHTAVEDFDFRYLRYRLGQPGNLALQELAESEFAQAHPELKRRVELHIKQAQSGNTESLVDTNDLGELAQQFRISPEMATMPESLLVLLANQDLMCLNQPDPCRAVRIDDDPSIQWLIYDQYTFQAKAYAESNQAWHWVGGLVSLGSEQKHHAEECLHSYSYSKLQRIPESLNIYRTGSCLHFLRPSLEFVRQQLSTAEN
ncbi:DUF4153 domain-containing protein [Halomonas sp. N3-2A]|uniref:DUF4153 domain-containing protein n=1 Tax=Halomonas sp. N3-2A TaxID=2014541 RepID=UPI000B5B33B7|nr:DUF4153 domain-containing protein [Halomonas sp. N3-2A]ASK19578.1 DUF4153 domain-containing protein [Halomonas sp. N3-2A]